MPEKPSGILETALYAEDLDAAEQFYGDLLKLEKILRAGTRHLFYKVGNSMLLIFNPHETRHPALKGIIVPPHGAIGPGHICFRATDNEIEEWKQVFEKNNIPTEMDFHWPNGARSLYVRDPANNSIEFAEPRLWGFEK